MRRRFSSRRVVHERDTCFIVCCAIGQLLERGSSLRHRCYWPALRDRTAGDSERQIDDLDPLVAVDEAFAPDGVEIGEWLLRDGFLGGFSRGLQFLNAIARSDQHVPESREVCFVAERAVPRNNLGVIAGERENFVDGGNSASDCAARTGVDVGIYPVEKQVTHLNHVGPFKMNVDVPVRMCGGKVLEREGFAIGLQLVTGAEGLLWQSLYRRRGDMHVDECTVWSSI